MKTLSLLFLIILSLSSCALFKSKKTKTASPTAEATPVKLPKDLPTLDTVFEAEPAEDVIVMAYSEVGNAFLSSLKNGNTNSLKPFMADVSVAKTLSPKETKGMTDKEIENKMLTSLHARFDDNFNKLIAAAKENKVDLAPLRLLNCIYHETTDPQTVPRALTIEIGTSTAKYSIPVTVINLANKTYIFEILKTTGVFN
ncbi:MAG: hypothetical protein H6607_08640 [Flavobacteriales bacterium]|nr:hypothetical protein [Flavobacteriales bacterium]